MTPTFLANKLNIQESSDKYKLDQGNEWENNRASAIKNPLHVKMSAPLQRTRKALLREDLLVNCSIQNCWDHLMSLLNSRFQSEQNQIVGCILDETVDKGRNRRKSTQLH
ncbi:hypothetical protein QAD02_006292 [Eretmocerus hayati]|uniref:Uncharacterized protein n=1 Tax=Eretmocerus hayati TaxID=131215 RepID=A0ACC2N0I0_9HYME|nr:hypothetical protein QAD02_006292 [Eretmocerus hayati]